MEAVVADAVLSAWDRKDARSMPSEMSDAGGCAGAPAHRRSRRQRESAAGAADIFRSRRSCGAPRGQSGAAPCVRFFSRQLRLRKAGTPSDSAAVR